MNLSCTTNGDGVQKIIAGDNVTLEPSSGEGIVKINCDSKSFIGFPDWSTFTTLNDKIFVLGGQPQYVDDHIEINYSEQVVNYDSYTVTKTGYILARIALKPGSATETISEPSLNVSLRIKNSSSTNKWFIACHWHTNTYICETQMIPVYQGNVIHFQINQHSYGTVYVGANESSFNRGIIFVPNRTF